MKRSLLVYGVLGAAGLALAGCHIPNASGFEGATPTAATVTLNVPEGTAALADDGVTRSALLGQEAESYRLTRAVTSIVNVSTGAVLVLVRTIVSFPPTERDGDVAIWGPHSEPLAKNAWRLTVTRLAKNQFHWELDGKAKAADDSAFVTILSGNHTRAVNDKGRHIDHYGNGDFTIDWDVAATLPDHDAKNAGRATFTYARLSPGAAETIDVDFHGVKDEDDGEIFDAVYRYAATPGAGGDFKYGAKKDESPDPGNTGTAKETVTLHSRWMESGAGRADYKVIGEVDLAALGGSATASECWDTGFASVYRETSYDDPSKPKDWGAETSCAFPTADYSTVAP